MANRLKVENGLSVTKMLLCQLIGVDKSEFDIAFDDFPSAVSPLDYYVAPETGLENRAESKLLDKSVEAAKLQLRMKRGENLPWERVLRLSQRPDGLAVQRGLEGHGDHRRVGVAEGLEGDGGALEVVAHEGGGHGGEGSVLRHGGVDGGGARQHGVAAVTRHATRYRQQTRVGVIRSRIEVGVGTRRARVRPKHLVRAERHGVAERHSRSRASAESPRARRRTGTPPASTRSLRARSWRLGSWWGVARRRRVCRASKGRSTRGARRTCSVHAPAACGPSSRHDAAHAEPPSCS